MTEAQSSTVQQWVQVDGATHYDPVSYLPPWRMAAIGYQFKLLHTHFPDSSVMEVGVGAGLTTALLRQLGHRVETIDVDEKLSPDILGSITEIPCEADRYGAFVCCQVLEHIKWELVDIALAELARVVTDGGVISVPTNRPTLLLMKYDSKSWGTRRVTFGSRRNKPIRNKDGEHYWELEANVTTEDLRKKLRAAGFRIVEEIQAVECMYHQFFVLQKTKT